MSVEHRVTANTWVSAHVRAHEARFILSDPSWGGEHVHLVMPDVSALYRLIGSMDDAIDRDLIVLPDRSYAQRIPRRGRTDDDRDEGPDAEPLPCRVCDTLGAHPDDLLCWRCLADAAAAEIAATMEEGA